MNPVNRTPIAIALTAVVSSQLAAYGYNAPEQTLAIRFNPKDGEPKDEGSLYHFFGVEPATAQALSTADSKGSFFLSHIKKKYDYQKIEPTLEEVKPASQERTFAPTGVESSTRPGAANEAEGAAQQA